MNYRKSWYFLWTACCMLLANVCLFLVGYFPLERNSSGFSSPRDVKLPLALCGLPSNTVHDTSYENLHPKMVLVLIDALRYDFINPVSFPFTNKLLDDGQGLKFRSKAAAPTVTLPRIKSILSGVIPGYADIVVNLDATRLNSDNIVYQAHSQLRKQYFFGDDTWLKLFPPEYFSKHESTTSFFVNDFREVDLNVTRNLRATIAEDWQIMFLHYLGLDHLGHLMGPEGFMVEEKFQEMDSVIEFLYKNLPEGSLIVVTGDHGMTARGNHGGTSHEEIDTALAFIITGKDKFLPQPRLHNDHEVHQVDIAPTLALLLGLPIPKGSYGSLIPAIITRHPKLSIDQRLYRYQYNTQQMLHVFSETFESEMDKYQSVRSSICEYLRLVKDDQPVTEELASKSERALNISMTMMKTELLKNRSTYNLYSLFTGFVGASLCSVAVIICAFAENMEFGFDRRLVLTSFLLGFATSAFMGTLLLGVTLPREIISLCFLTVSTYILLCALKSFGWNRVKFGLSGVGVLGAIQFLGVLLHALSLFGSSFVEEEHQTWYFLSVSIGVAGAMLAPSMKIGTEEIIKVFRVLLLSRILRDWNRTGDKWMHLPDYADFVSKHQTFETVLLLVTCYNVANMFMMRNSTRQGRLCAFSSTLIILYKLSVVYYGEQHHIIAWLYLLLPAVLILGIWEFVSSENKREVHLHPLSILSNIWMLLGFILQRPENTFMFGLEIFLENAVYTAVREYNVTIRSIIYFWFANAAFFHQGNSNKLSTIDVASGYVGVSFYEPVLVGMLIYCHTFSGYIHWFIMFWRRATYNLGPKDKLRVTGIMLSLKLTLTSWYLLVMIIHASHLFVWSVFSPKGLYEGVLALTIVLIHMVISALNV